MADLMVAAPLRPNKLHLGFNCRRERLCKVHVAPLTPALSRAFLAPAQHGPPRVERSFLRRRHR